MKNSDHCLHLFRKSGGVVSGSSTRNCTREMSAHFSNLCDKFRVLEFEVNEVPPPAPASNYPKQTKRWSDSDPSAIQISNPYVRPGRIDTLELARNMDIHNPNGCSDYGGCLPLSPTCQVVTRR